MTSHESSTAAPSFYDRLRNAGIEPDDSEELRLNKALLMLATGLVSVAIMVWVTIYSILGPQFSATLPFAFQILLAGNMIFYIRSRNFDFFRISQLGLFLFLPFIALWSGGTIISTSGVMLWALLAPVGAILCIGVNQSVGWFIAWVILTALSGAADFYLADSVIAQKSNVPIRTTIFFFALNFISVSTIIYMLLRLSIAEKRKMQQSLEEAHQQVQVEQERSEKLLLNILPGAVAERLKNSNKTIADGFADVTVMFADIVNFTQVAANMSPSQVFAMLNRIFSAFDELAEQYGLEKIKTIGDAYMVAGGLNEELPEYAGRRRRHGGIHARPAAARFLGQRGASRSAHRHRHRTDRRRRAGQEEVHLRPLGRHGEHRQPHHLGRCAGDDPVRHHDLPSPGRKFRFPRAADHLPQGQGQHDGVSTDRPQKWRA
jgi:adenylate cyclase